MPKSQHVLKVKKGNTTYTCELYTTANEARNRLYPGKYVRFKKDGVNLYAPLTTTFNSASESTPLYVYKNGDTTKYCIAQKAFYRVNVTAVANATITAKAFNGDTQIASWNSGAKWFPYGTKITASGVGSPNNIWNDPSLAIDRGFNSGELLTESNIEISAASAVTRKSYRFTLNPGSNQTVTIKYTEPGKSEASVDVSGSSRQFTVLAGTTWTASITSVATGFNKGSLNATKGTITGSGVSITASNATRKNYTLKLNGTTGQTITLYFTQPGSSQQTKTSTSSAQSWTVAYGTTYKAKLAANTGYTKGSLSIAENTNYTLGGDVTVSATAAKAITPSITFSRTGKIYKDYCDFAVTYTNTSGSKVTTGNNPSSVTIKYNTTIVIKRTYKYYSSSSYSLSIYQGSTFKIKLHQNVYTWTSAGLTGNTSFRLDCVYEWEPSEGGDGDSPGGADGD